MRTTLVVFDINPLLSLVFLILSPSTIFCPSSSILKVKAYNSFVYPENYGQIELPKVNGPESFAFDCHGKGPYASVSDGRVLRWDGSKSAWKEFAITAPNRPKELCDGSTNPDTETACGRPLGLKFDPTSCNLYIADAYFGLLVVGPNGGVAQQVATSADGSAFGFTNALDIDDHTGVVYFTDSSTEYQRRHWILSILSGDRTGRLMRYDPRSKKTTVLLRGLGFADGVALSDDMSFLLVAESATFKIYRLWLRGPKVGSPEIFAQLTRSPDNIKRAADGGFWVALNSGRAVLGSLIRSSPGGPGLPAWIRDPVALKLDRDGNVVEAVDGAGAAALESVSEVAEHGGALWLGSAVKNYVAVIRRTR